MKKRKFLKTTMLCVSIMSFYSNMINPMMVLACSENDEVCSHDYHTWNDHYLKSSNGNRQGTKYVWISSDFSANNGERGYVTSGVLAWNSIPYITNYVKLQTTSEKSEAQLWVEIAELESSVMGVTYVMEDKDDPLIDLYGLPWYDFERAVVFLNETEISLSKSWIMPITTHEVGHALGLSHVTCAESIMYPVYNYGLFSDSITSIDRASLRHIYC